MKLKWMVKVKVKSKTTNERHCAIQQRLGHRIIFANNIPQRGTQRIEILQIEQYNNAQIDFTGLLQSYIWNNGKAAGKPWMVMGYVTKYLTKYTMTSI